jgi:hypothetical protein
MKTALADFVIRMKNVIFALDAKPLKIASKGSFARSLNARLPMRRVARAMKIAPRGDGALTTASAYIVYEITIVARDRLALKVRALHVKSMPTVHSKHKLATKKVTVLCAWKMPTAHIQEFVPTIPAYHLIAFRSRSKLESQHCAILIETVEACFASAARAFLVQ